MSKPIEFRSLSELPWQCKIGGGVGLALGSSLCAYVEYRDQKCDATLAWFDSYLRLFGISFFGGIVGAGIGPMAATVWPIPCCAAIVASIGLGAKYAYRAVSNQ